MQIGKLGHERAIGMLEPLSVPLLEFPGPVEDLLLDGHEVRGQHGFRLAPAFGGPCLENRDIQSPLLREDSAHALQQRGFLGVQDAGVAVEIGVDFEGGLIEAAAGLGVPVGGSLRDELLHGLVVVLNGEPKSGKRARTLRQRASGRQFLSAHFREEADRQNAGHQQERQQQYGNPEEQPAQFAGRWRGFPPCARIRILSQGRHQV